MQSNGTNFLEIYAPPYYFFTNPYVMKDFDHYMRVWNGKLGQQAQAQMEKNGNLKYLGTVYRGLRQTTAKKPLYTPADVYNMKLRLPVLPTWMAVWKAIGADPVGCASRSSTPGLKSGKAEASEGDVSQITSFKLDEVQKPSDHDQPPGPDWWDAHPQAFLRQPVEGRPGPDRQGGEGGGGLGQRQDQDRLRGPYLLDLQRKGMQVVIPDADSFRAKAKPAVERAVQDPMVGHNLGRSAWLNRL